MNEILLVCATQPEAQWLIDSLNFSKTNDKVWEITLNGNTIKLLVTGIGMVNTAIALTQYAGTFLPRMAINFGIAGTFDLEINLGQVVQVHKETFGDLGAQDHDKFLNLETMGFENFRLANKSIFNVLENSASGKFGEIRKVTGLTVNKVHGSTKGIEEVRSSWPEAQIETMEGAAFFQCMLQSSIPFYQFRGISNIIEPRNRTNWKIKEAVLNVQKFIAETVLPQLTIS